MSDELKRAARIFEEQSPEDPPEKRRTLAEQDVEGSTKRVCRTCGEWKLIGDFRDHICDDCEREFRMGL
jgi:ribosomal protein L32